MVFLAFPRIDQARQRELPLRQTCPRNSRQINPQRHLPPRHRRHRRRRRGSRARDHRRRKNVHGPGYLGIGYGKRDVIRRKSSQVGGLSSPAARVFGGEDDDCGPQFVGVVRGDDCGKAHCTCGKFDEFGEISIVNGPNSRCREGSFPVQHPFPFQIICLLIIAEH